eukprot:TRINITY_DN7689_c0_g1_i3.p1 TRINITY_DN7689_c0_g1~~TRINITY_DN7689_c0_g1_i3.p1  ORF type:complete len:214 (-),score=67.96 TRINITY_DN7689_c0_g1_i3:115-756(-)
MKCSYLNHKLVEGLPTEFEDFMNHLNTLEYDSKPDYRYLLGNLSDLYKRLGGMPETKFDWEGKPADHHTVTRAALLLKKRRQEHKELTPEVATNPPDHSQQQEACTTAQAEAKGQQLQESPSKPAEEPADKGQYAHQHKHRHAKATTPRKGGKLKEGSSEGSSGGDRNGEAQEAPAVDADKEKEKAAGGEKNVADDASDKSGGKHKKDKCVIS